MTEEDKNWINQARKLFEDAEPDNKHAKVGLNVIEAYDHIVEENENLRKALLGIPYGEVNTIVGN